MTTLTPQSLEVSGFKKGYVNGEVLKEMPDTTGPVQFFKIDRWMNAKEMDEEYQKRGLVPAPMALLEAHKADKNLAEEKQYTAAQWKDKDGNYCCLAFGRWNGEREVDCRRHGLAWGGYWFLAGVPASGKSSALSPLDLIREIEERLAELKKLVSFRSFIGETK